MSPTHSTTQNGKRLQTNLAILFLILSLNYCCCNTVDKPVVIYTPWERVFVSQSTGSLIYNLNAQHAYVRVSD